MDLSKTVLFSWEHKNQMTVVSSGMYMLEILVLFIWWFLNLIIFMFSRIYRVLRRLILFKKQIGKMNCLVFFLRAQNETIHEKMVWVWRRTPKVRATLSRSCVSRLNFRQSSYITQISDLIFIEINGIGTLQEIMLRTGMNATAGLISAFALVPISDVVLGQQKWIWNLLSIYARCSCAYDFC